MMNKVKGGEDKRGKGESGGEEKGLKVGWV